METARQITVYVKTITGKTLEIQSDRKLTAGQLRQMIPSLDPQSVVEGARTLVLIKWGTILDDNTTIDEGFDGVTIYVAQYL